MLCLEFSLSGDQPPCLASPGPHLSCSSAFPAHSGPKPPLPGRRLGGLLWDALESVSEVLVPSSIPAPCPTATHLLSVPYTLREAATASQRERECACVNAAFARLKPGGAEARLGRYRLWPRFSSTCDGGSAVVKRNGADCCKAIYDSLRLDLRRSAVHTRPAWSLGLLAGPKPSLCAAFSSARRRALAGGQAPGTLGVRPPPAGFSARLPPGVHRGAAMLP